MPAKESLIKNLTAFISKSKFSIDGWENRGLNPSNTDLSKHLESVFNKIAENLVDAIDNDALKNLKSILKNGLKQFDKAVYDTEEKEFICDVFIEMAEIVNVDLKDDINKWLYGAILNSFMKVSKFLNQERIVETLNQPCSKCGIKLETIITQKKEDIPDSSWLLVKCNNCNEFNLISPGPNIKSLKFGNYQWVETLNKEEFTHEKALIRLEQIKFFRK